MAIVKFGPTVVGARGTIAGTIFTANKAGPYARGWSRGSNPRSALQSTLRKNFGDLASSWRDLSDAQRDDWIDYADDPAQEKTNSLGETFFASGFNWYIEINLALGVAGAAVRVDAPTLTKPIAPTIQSWVVFDTPSPGASRVDYTGEGPELSELHGIDVRLFNSKGRTAAASGFTFMVLEVPGPGDQVGVQDEMETAFGTIIIGQRAFVSTYIQDAHGQHGPVSTANTTVIT